MKIQSLITCLMLAGCASSGTQAALSDDTIPRTPYTADQIREGCPAGTTMVLRMESSETPTVLNHMRFKDTDEEGATIEGWNTSVDGTSMGGRQAGRSTWEELRDHAVFPPQSTRRERARISVPAGTFDCWLYHVTGDEDGVVSRFWFADDLPGPPVRLEVEHEGTILTTMVMIEHTRA